MPVFDFSFTVDAPLSTVSAFHGGTDVLKILTPPPIFVQVHEFGELAEGMVAKFTLWFGPVPVKWEAHHVNVSETSFTDVQASGPMAKWAHTHTFSAESPAVTRVNEHIEYEYPAGTKGIMTRLLFNNPGLFGMFTYRKMITRYHCRKMVRNA